MKNNAIPIVVRVVAMASVLTVSAIAQNTGSTGAAIPGVTRFGNNYHVGFERPEAWGLKYFTSTTLLSGLQPPERTEDHRVGAVTVGIELGWVPTLDEGQMRIGFNGMTPEDLNKAPIVARPTVRIGLPWMLTGIVAALPPIRVFDVRTHVLEFGLERPILDRDRWTLSWRGYGQVGSVTGSFSCPENVLGFAPGSAGNPTSCVARSEDVATLRYAGSEVEFAYRIPGMPKLVPHVAAGGNFIDAAFQTRAPVVNGYDETRLWTRGGIFSGTFGASYLVTKQVAITVDAFYSPLWVTRSATASRTNDGLFNVRAMLSYSFR